FLVVNAPFLAANSSEHERTALFGLNNALGFLAAVVGSLLGGGLPAWFRGLPFDGHGALAWLRPLLVRNADARTLQVALMASALIAVPAFVPILFLKDERRVSSPPDFLSPRGRGEPEWSAAWWARWGTLKSRLSVGWRATAREARGVIGRLSATQALIGFGAGLYFPYLSIYFVNDLHTSLTFYGVFSAVMTVSLAGASLLSAPLAARYGKMPVSVIAQILSIPFLVALGLFPIVWIVSATLLVRTFLMNIPGAPLSAYLMEAVPQTRRVIASGVYNVSFQLVGALGAGVGGILIKRIGFPLTIEFAAPFYAVSSILLIVWFGLRRQPAAPPVDDELPSLLVASEPLKR
ncbi:MAG: MFS transporter, partial [Ktedonobacterales bacterium]